MLTFTITVDEPSVIETEELDTATLTATQTLDAGYGGELIDISDILDKLGAEEITILDNDGGYVYTANYGFWFDAEGNIAGWSDAYFFVEPAYNDDADFIGLQTGIHPDHATAGASYTATFRVADLNTMKHVTVTLTVNVTE